MKGGQTVTTTPTASRWFEKASGANAIVQLIYALIFVVMSSGLWLVRLEVRNQYTDDRFAVIEARRAERAVERADAKKDMVTLHEDIVDLRLAIVRLDTRIDETKGKNK
jgi:hypothetical protein